MHNSKEQDDAIRKTAVNWRITLRKTKSIDDVWWKFDAWLKESPAHEAAYRREEQSWRQRSRRLKWSLVILVLVAIAIVAWACMSKAASGPILA